MIKGRYVALVEIDFAITDNAKNLRPFEAIRENIVNGGMTHELREIITKEFFDVNYPGVVKVTQQYADVVEVNA